MPERFPGMRELFAETATEFTYFCGFTIPSNDGKDDPDWEYENVERIGQPVLRVPVRLKSERPSDHAH
jgi:hypothetical protein